MNRPTGSAPDALLTAVLVGGLVVTVVTGGLAHWAAIVLAVAAAYSATRRGGPA